LDKSVSSKYENDAIFYKISLGTIIIFFSDFLINIYNFIKQKTILIYFYIITL
jgi:hypothetical protein